jgi:hypothetical protein
MSTMAAHQCCRFNLLRASRACFFLSSRPALFVFEPLSPSDRRDNAERDNASEEQQKEGTG